MKLGDIAAFPVPGATRADGEILQYPEGGMTLRQYYAGLVLQAMMANSSEQCPHDKETVVKYATEYADALLTALEK